MPDPKENWCWFVCRKCEQRLPEDADKCPNPECAEEPVNFVYDLFRPQALPECTLFSWLMPQVGVTMFGLYGGKEGPQAPSELREELLHIAQVLLMEVDAEYRLPDVQVLMLTRSPFYEDWSNIEDLGWSYLQDFDGYFVRWKLADGQICHAFVGINS